MPKAAPKTKAKKIVIPSKTPSGAERSDLLTTLHERFEKNMHRHKGVKWTTVEKKLKPSHVKALNAMELTGGEPDVVLLGGKTLAFVDCAAESPSGRRSLCYDKAAWTARKKHKPQSSAQEIAKQMGVELLTEDEYRALQSVEAFDQKTSSWIETPANVRKLGGALFCDRRYDTVFTYHNGADSYYAARGFRAKLTV